MTGTPPFIFFAKNTRSFMKGVDIMTKDKSKIDNVVGAFKKFLPEKFEVGEVGTFQLFVYRTQLEMKVHMLRRQGYSEEFIDKYVDRSVELFARTLQNEEES